MTKMTTSNGQYQVEKNTSQRPFMAIITSLQFAEQ